MALDVPQLAVEALTVAEVIPAVNPTLNVIGNVHPFASFTINECVPAAKPENVDVVAKAAPSIE